MAPPHPALEQLIRSLPLFSLVEPEDSRELLPLLRPVELAPGQVLFQQGERASSMWVLGPQAEVSISAASPRGKRLVVAYARPGETVGEMALVDEGVRSGTAVVMQGGSAYRIDAAEFQALRARHCPAAFQVLRRICTDLCARLRATSDRIVPRGERVVTSPGLPGGGPVSGKLLDELPAFRGMPAVVKLALAQQLTLVEVPEVTPIFAEGEQADAAYFILSGEVTVGRGGKTLANLRAGSMFGMVSCIDQGRRSASCVAAGPARLLRLSDRDFDVLFAARHRFAFELLDLVARQLVEHLRAANQLLPLPGEQPRAAPVASIPAVSEEEVLPEPEILPLDLELDVEECPGPPAGA